MHPSETWRQVWSVYDVTERSCCSCSGGQAEYGNLKTIPICYVIAGMETPRAGTERHLLQLIRSLDREVFDPLLVVVRHSRWTREFRDPDVPLRVLGIGSLWRPASWMGIFRLARIMRRHRTQIAELYFVEGQFLGAIAARLARVPRVFSWRRDLAYQYGTKEKLMVRFTNRLVDRFLANSNAVRETIAKIERLESSRFDVIYNGIDLEEHDRQSNLAAGDQFDQFSKDKLVVTLVANLRPVKNIRCFLEAASRVAQSREDVVFLILGSGEEETSLKRYADQLGIGDRVCWGGSVPATAPYLKRSAVGCLSSNSEGLPNAVVEYMAAGLPVVATAVGGLAEVVADGVTGELVDKGDADGLAQNILELLNDPARRTEMGTAGRARVEERFSLSAQMEGYERVCLQPQPE